MTIVYGEHQLAMNYSNEELNLIIDQYIKKEKSEGRDVFSYKSLCYYIFSRASSEKRLKVETGHVYNNPVMMDADATLVSKLLWQRIWNRNIIIDFHENKYASNYFDDTRFCIL